MITHPLRRNRRMALGETTSPHIETYVTNWANKVVSNGGIIPSTNTQIILTNFYNTLISNNLFNKMIMVNCYVPDDLIACTTPLINVASSNRGVNATWRNTGFTASSDLSVNGLKGDTTKRYLDTGIDISGVFNSTTTVGGGITVYSIDSGLSNSLDVCEVGCSNSSNTTPACCLFLNNLGTIYGQIGDATAEVSVPNTGAGYYSVNRISQTIVSLYRANSTTPHFQIAQSLNSAPAIQTGTPMYVHARYNAASTLAYSWSPRTLSFVAFHTPLSLSDSSNFFNAIQALRQNLGGGYV